MSKNENLDPFIELKQVTRTFSGAGTRFVALDGVDLMLPAGQLVAVVGKSGSGKSTLLNLIVGIDRPTSGEVLVGGTPVHSLGERQLAAWRGRHVGVVFQSFQLLPTLTIFENVTLPMDFAGTRRGAKAREQALALLAKVGVADQAHKLPTELSGGQQQRAAIARALANNPGLLVADEPTGNLDTQTSRSVLELLAALSRRGTTVLLVTHERDVAGIADRVVTLADGRVVDDRASGRPARRLEVAHA